MPETRQAWDAVGAGCSDLGGRLKKHFHQVREDDAAEATEALRKLALAVGDAFEAVGNAARDPEVRTEARRVAGSLTEALGATFAGLGDEVRRVFHKDDATGEPPPPGPSTWAPPHDAPGETPDATPGGVPGDSDAEPVDPPTAPPG